MEALIIKEKSIQTKSYFVEDYVNGFDKKLLHTVSWIPVTSPWAVILVVHSAGEHITRYKRFAQYFSDYGIAVMGLDMHGHGKSQGKKGRTKYQHLLSDVKRLIDLANIRYPNIPKIVFGHGLGGNLAMSYATRNNCNLMALISASPWIKIVNNYSPFLLSFLSLVIKVFPIITIKNNYTGSDLTSDSKNIEEYNQDPLIHKKISVRLLFSVQKSGEYLLHNKHKINMPLLLMHGSNDKIASWHATSDFAKYTSQSTSLKIWKGSLHELHNDIDKDLVFEYILHWIEQLPGIH